jgi:L-asparaginase / beta-aspartyl-peptidase
MVKNKFGLAIHGGAGTILRSSMTPQKEKAYTDALSEAIDSGYSILKNGGTAIEAVEQAVIILEDCDLFNAGKGSVFTSSGTHEMDASIMCGKTLDAGAVSMLKHIKNPIKLAREVMNHSEHVFLAGDGAEAFAMMRGFEKMDPSYFYDEFRFQQWMSVKGTDEIMMDHTSLKQNKYGTVGAVALDSEGNLAAATSTGGMTNKKYGRIGDTPMIGSGTYADNSSMAVSCTGSGEYFIRLNVAFHLCSLVKYGKLSMMNAGHALIHDKLGSLGGDGGLIAIDTNAEIIMPYNTEGMYRAFRTSEKPLTIGIYNE